MKKYEKRWATIDEIVLGIKETISFSSLEELIEALEIQLKIVDASSPILNGNLALIDQNNRMIYTDDQGFFEKVKAL